MGNRNFFQRFEIYRRDVEIPFKKSCFVTQEIYAALIMHNMTVVVSQCVEIHQRKRKYEYKIRFSNAVCIVKSLLTGGVSPPAAEMLIRKNLSPIRPNRGYPRKRLR